MEELISVIVPIYKVEAYLERCIGSIVNQTYKNLEIILVDDGSPDSCPDICDAWKEKDDRIKVIHKKNGGLSDARNYGMQAATGDYITFVDGDDVVSSKYVEYLVKISKCTGADICCINHIEFFELKDIVFDIHGESPFKTYDKYDFLNNNYYESQIINSATAWGKLYKKGLFKNISFPNGKIHEDTFTTYKLYLKANKIGVSSNKLYFYRKRPGSIMSTRNINSFDNLIEAQIELLKVSDKKIEILKKKIAYDTYHQILCFVKNYKIAAFCRLNILKRKMRNFNELYLRINFTQRSILHLIIFFSNITSIFVRGLKND